MRLSQDQIRAIWHAAKRVVGDDVRVSLFGSRAQDALKGGDIDLYFETDRVLENRVKVVCQLAGALTIALGDRKIDVLVKDANTPMAPIFDIAQCTGVPL